MIVHLLLWVSMLLKRTFYLLPRDSLTHVYLSLELFPPGSRCFCTHIHKLIVTYWKPYPVDFQSSVSPYWNCEDDLHYLCHLALSSLLQTMSWHFPFIYLFLFFFNFNFFFLNHSDQMRHRKCSTGFWVVSSLRAIQQTHWGNCPAQCTYFSMLIFCTCWKSSLGIKGRVILSLRVFWLEKS